jgi:putative chitinase
MNVTKDQLISIIGINKIKLIERLINPINDCLNKFEINTQLRVCHFLAQVLHESGCFLYFEEIASGIAYEGRKDLGNIQKGDGVKFKGRGLIQITGKSNYTAISKDLGVDFINNPKLLSNDKYGVLSAGWYWNKKNLNLYADKDDIKNITRIINGGYNGLEDRVKWYNKCKLIIK